MNRSLSAAFFAAILLAGGYYLHQKPTGNQPTATTPNLALYQYSASKGRGTTPSTAGIGYVLGTTTKTSKASTSVAYAASSSYTPTIFYAKVTNGLSGIFAYSLETTKQTLVSTETDAEQPLFSSINQKLAYATRPNQDPNLPVSLHCEVIVEDYTTKSTDLRISQPGDHCFQPMSWSPDGTHLLLLDEQGPHPISVDETDTRINDLYLYDTTTKQVHLLKKDAPSSKTMGEGGFWIDNQTIAITLVTTGPTPYALNISTNAVTPILTGQGEFVGSYSRSGANEFYLVGQSPAQYPGRPVNKGLVWQLTAQPTSAKVVSGSSLTRTYLPSPDGALVIFDYLSASGSDTNYLGGLEWTTLSDSHTEQQLVRDISSLTLLGCINDSTHVAYSHYDNEGELHINVLSLSDKKDTTLF